MPESDQMTDPELTRGPIPTGVVPVPVRQDGPVPGDEAAEE
jgi:hypothetical protein